MNYIAYFETLLHILLALLENYIICLFLWPKQKSH